MLEISPLPLLERDFHPKIPKNAQPQPLVTEPKIEPPFFSKAKTLITDFPSQGHDIGVNTE